MTDTTFPPPGAGQWTAESVDPTAGEVRILTN